MTNLSNMIVDSDFDSLKFDNTITGSVTIPDNYKLNGSTRQVWYSDVSVGSTPLDVTYFSHVLTNNKNRILTIQTGLININSSMPYTIVALCFYVSSTTIRYQLEVYNPYTTVNTLFGITVNFLSYMFEDPFETS